MRQVQEYTCDIAIMGGGMGGVAAALAALEQGYKVILTETTDWLGGQMTSQGVSAFDEHPHIETFGCTKRYAELRQRIRTYYQEKYGVTATMKNGQPLNPGNGWVSRLCFEPKVGEQVLREMLKPYIPNKSLQIFCGLEPIKAVAKNHVVEKIILQDKKKHIINIKAKYFLDATELGDLLPLTKTEYVSGTEAKSDTNEPHARDVAKPDEVQSFTFCFAVEYCKGETHTIKKSKGYELFKKTQPYSLMLDEKTLNKTSGARHFKMFKKGSKGTLPFWTYRRIFDAKLLGQGNDIALINWASNDYRFANVIDKSKAEQKRILREAKDLSLGFLYWLQTECPRDDGSFGYPEFKLRKDVMGTRDGLSKTPYIRESRRIKTVERVLEQDITLSENTKAAKRFANSVGIGWYQMDLHPCVGNDDVVSMFEPTLPFQIPLGTLIPIKTKNLLPACKNIGTTHLTNGAYRLHPIEWAIGEAAGVLAAFCLEHKITPKQVWESKKLTRHLQKKLIKQGAPLEWPSGLV